MNWFNKRTTMALGIFILLAVTPNQSFSADEKPAVDAAAAAPNAKIQTAVGMSQLKNLTCEELLHETISSKLKTLCTELKESAVSCSGKYDHAASICNTETNPNLLSTIAQVQALMGAAQGLTDSCNNFSKAMGLAKTGMAAYSMYCGTVQKTCDVICSKATASLKQYESVSKTTQEALSTCIKKNDALYNASLTPGPPNLAAKAESEKCGLDLMHIQGNLDPVAMKDNASTGPTVTAKSDKCKVDMMSLLGMAVINLGSLAQSKAMSDQCDKDTNSNTAAATAVDCTKEENKTKTECASTVVDCGLTANADKPICICKANPRVTGCEGVSTALATNSTMSTGSDGTTSGRGANGKLTAAPGAATDKKFPADLSKTSKNDGSGIGGGGGGSTAGLSANSDVGSSDGTKLEKAENAGNANILTNESGGGSGYRFGFGGSSGSKAQLRKLAGDNGFKGKLTAQDWSAQVTSNGGKSNFDKVKVRYIENRTSLLNR